MLPHSTHERIEREASRGKQHGRTLEIQRLIGRSLRSIVNLEKLGERQIKIDCDVIQADGGTRTAAISGAYVALFLALTKLKEKNLIQEIPLTEEIAAVSCGIYNDTAILDLDYAEDSNAAMDCNFVLTSNGNIIEIQGTAEKNPIAYEEMTKLYELAKDGIAQIVTAQRKAILSKKF
jgi:ribonuclease PH